MNHRSLNIFALALLADPRSLLEFDSRQSAPVVMAALEKLPGEELASKLEFLGLRTTFVPMKRAQQNLQATSLLSPTRQKMTMIRLKMNWKTQDIERRMLC